MIIVVVIAAWYAWRYYRLRGDLDEYASHIRGQDVNTNIRELENLSSSIASLIATFNAQHAVLESERLRLATVLDQITDGVLIASMVDGVILVVHAGKSSRQVVRRARQLLQDVGAKIFGVVLNNVNLRSQDNYYYYQSYYHRNNYRPSDEQ